MGTDLSDRQRLILKLVIQEYIRTGRAVGSKALIDRYRLDVSPATVRNEMVELEERSYLQHLHTSAGRVPTDQGYRYYVEYLVDDPVLSPAEQIMIRHQFRQTEMHVESWAKLAAAVLADVSGNLSLVTPARGRVERLRHFELIGIRDRVVLMIVVTQSGSVREVVLPVLESVDQDQLSAVSRRLNPEIRNRSSRAIAERARQETGLSALALRSVADALRAIEEQNRSEVYYEGLDLALNQPEFSRGPNARRLVELLRGGAILSALLPQLHVDEDLQVFIGSENRSEDLRPFGVVVGTYGVNMDVTGILGVLGPTRMSYERSISTVRYLAQVLSDLMQTIYTYDAPGR